MHLSQFNVLKSCSLPCERIKGVNTIQVFLKIFFYLNNLTLQETIGELDWAWRNSLFTVFLQSGMVSLNVKKDN